MFSRPASAADSKQQQRLASAKGGSTACACFAKVCLRGLSFDRCAVRPQSRAVSAAVWRAAPDSRCPRRAAGAREQDWICPITLELMRNPVSTADGQARGALTGYRGSAYGEPIGRGREGPDTGVRARCNTNRRHSLSGEREKRLYLSCHTGATVGSILAPYPGWRCRATPLQPRPGPMAGLRAGGDRGLAAPERHLAPHWRGPCHQNAGATRTRGGGTRDCMGRHRGEGGEWKIELGSSGLAQLWKIACSAPADAWP